MLQYRNIVLFTDFFDVAKLTTQTPLPLLFSCRLSFPTVGLKIFSLPTLALKSNKIHVKLQELIE
jgi:hypothetical protein